MAGIYTIPDFGPSDLMTSDFEGARRVKVEDSSTAQASGFEFQTAQTSTGSTTPQVLRVTAPQPIDVTEMEMTIVIGGVNVQIYEASQGTPSGTFTAVPVQSTNPRKLKSPTFSIASGGTFAPTGNALRQMMVNGGTAVAPLASQLRVNSKRLSLPAGTYYIVTGLLSGVSTFTGQLIVTITEV